MELFLLSFASVEDQKEMGNMFLLVRSHFLFDIYSLLLLFFAFLVIKSDKQNCEKHNCTNNDKPVKNLEAAKEVLNSV